jgi:hypothetical protein
MRLKRFSILNFQFSIDRWVALALALYSLLVTAAILVAGVHVRQDDGFYYLTIARHIAQGAGSTFDGLHPTNGYHPLWLLCLTPIVALAPAPERALTLATIAQGIMMAIGCGILYLTARLTCGRAAAGLASMLWIALTDWTALSGREWSLHALCLLTLAYIYGRWFVFAPPGRRAYLALGLLAGLTILARLETLLLAIVLGAALALAEPRARMSPDGVCTLYVGVNLWLFGHMLPISGVVKQGWSAQLLAADSTYQRYGWLAAKLNLLLWPFRTLSGPFPFVVAIGTVGFWIVDLGCWLGRARPASGRSLARRLVRLWWPFALFGTLQLFANITIYHAGLSFPPWYYVVQPWLAMLLVAMMIDWIAATRATLWRWRPGLIVAIALWCAVPTFTFFAVRQWQLDQQLGRSPEPLRDAALWARAHIPAGATIAAWNAGTLGYLSGRRVVNLDGVVNSWDYYQAERFDLCRYWRATGVDYVVDVFERGQAASVVPTIQSYASCASQLELIWSDDHYGASWRVEAYLFN